MSYKATGDRIEQHPLAIAQSVLIDGRNVDGADEVHKGFHGVVIDVKQSDLQLPALGLRPGMLPGQPTVASV